MDILGAKLITGSVFFLVAVCFTFLPFWVIRRCCLKRGTNPTHHNVGPQILLVQCLYSLASGVLIGTCLIHLLPESLETFQEAVSSRHQQHLDQPAHTNSTNLTDNATSVRDSNPGQYPLAELFVALGFLAVYLLDNGMKSCSKYKTATNFIDNAITDEDVAFLSTDESSASQSTTARDNDACQSGQQCDHKLDDASISKLHHMFKGVTSKMSRTTAPYTPVAQTEAEAGEERLPAILNTTDCNSLDNLLPTRSLDSLHRVDISEADHFVSIGQAGNSRDRARTTTKHLRSAALVAALCVHGFFDGVVVGLQTSVPVVLSLALAISLHKSFVCVGLSLSLLRMGGGQTSTMCVCILLFAMASPLGMLVSGVFLQEMSGEAGNGGVSLTPACLQTFAVGTFLYVSVLEITERQQSQTSSAELVKQIAMFLGFGLMAGLRAVAGAS
ncbi:hypothetical protein BsWGS_04032 [Bradybaena similaris]